MAMDVEIKEVRESNFQDIPSLSSRVDCKSCDFWEGGVSVRGDDAKLKEAEKLKRIRQRIVRAMLLYLNGQPAGFCQFGPLSAFARAEEWRCRLKTPLPEHPFYITCVSIQKPFRGKGLATLLVKHVLNELKTCGVKAVEAFVQKPYCERWSSGPVELYLKCGFSLVEDRPQGCLMRLAFD